MRCDMKLKVGQKIKTLDGDQDCDENDDERMVPPGSVGEVVRVEIEPTGPHYHVRYPNGTWVVLEDEDLHRYEVLDDLDR